MGGWGSGRVPSWGTLEEAEMLEAKAGLGPALMGKKRGLREQGEPYTLGRPALYSTHIVCLHERAVSPTRHYTHVRKHIHGGSKEASRSQDQMRARLGLHSALTLVLVPRQGKSWSGASSRRTR